MMFFNQGIISDENYCIFTNVNGPYQILFYDQEPIIEQLTTRYIESIIYLTKYTNQEIKNFVDWPKEHLADSSKNKFNNFYVDKMLEHKNSTKNYILVTSEHSSLKDELISKYDLNELYYFFHGFAALDWFRGFYALNFSSPVDRSYQYDYVSYNRIINNDRSYRIYWISKLSELNLLGQGQISFNVTDNTFDDWRDEVADSNSKLSDHARRHAELYLTDINKLVIDQPELPGSASADIPRTVDALWNIVTETVFYYNKLHLTEKIFKPIVSKQPFMLLAAPGNLAYLRSYGFKTFDGIIDESYDTIIDNDQRINAVAEQLQWYCSLSQEEKSRVIECLAPIVEYNFHHFYGEFRHIITQELLDNTKALFKEIGYDDKTIAYEMIHKVLTN